MKKILLKTTLVAILTTSSVYAGASDNFYAKVGGGASMPFKQKAYDVKLKSQTTGYAEVGVGYYFRNDLRMELTLSHLFNPQFKQIVTINSPTLTAGTTLNGIVVPAGSKINAVINGKMKINADTLLLNGFYDVYDFQGAKLFIGAGVGMSHLTGEVSANTVHTGLDANGVAIADATRFILTSVKAKAKNNPSYAAYLGASTEITSGVNAELMYSYRYLGQLKFNHKIPGTAKITLKSHNIGLGVRFDL